MTQLDRSNKHPGYWPSPWPVECGGNRRQKATAGGVYATSGTAKVTTRVNNRWNVMVVQRDADEWYLGGTMAAFSGAPPFGWVERIDAETLEPLAETADVAEADEIEGRELAATPTPTPPPTATPIPLGTICVSVFADENENGRQDDEEGIMADVAVTIKRDGQPLTTFVTMPADIRDCVEDLEPGSYQVVITPPGQYRPTTSPAWATALQGSILSVAFGIVVEPPTPTPIPTTAPTAVPTSTPTLLGSVGTSPLLIGVGILLLVVLVGGLLLLRAARRL